jgi:hypothetical protein
MKPIQQLELNTSTPGVECIEKVDVTGCTVLNLQRDKVKCTDMGRAGSMASYLKGQRCPGDAVDRGW